MQTGNSFPLPALSLLTPIGYQSSSCGYCKEEESSQRTPDSRASYYIRASSLTPEHYQQLMDRGWRRSGNLLYLPDVSRSCCPHYTIRLPASEFRPSRDQRHALNRWTRYVLGERYLNEANVKYPKTKEEKKRKNNVFDLTTSVHESETSSLKPDLDPEHRFEVVLEPDTFTEEKYALFDNYQRHVHGEGDEDISRAGFKRFLCTSCVIRRTDGNGKKLGSYHQCYRLDGRLIAMAVLDLLPHAVSGVYFIYHSDYEKSSFGKLSALREASLALEQHYHYYYMGYYIHDCKKMRYKADYKPQYVLDYNDLEWYPLDAEMTVLMETQKYASMSQAGHRKARLAAATDHTPNSPSDTTNGSSAESPDSAVRYPAPLEAMNSGLSLVQLGMPGVLTLARLGEEVDLDLMRVQISKGRIVEMRYIQSWDSGSELDPTTLKGVFAELAAAIGPQLAREAVVNFS